MISIANLPKAIDPRVQAEAQTLFRQQRQRTFERVDRIFATVMLVQWAGAIVAAICISPRTWQGAESQTHMHVWLAVILGGAIASLPIYLALRHPGRVYTRHTIAIAQVLSSALLIHVTGGRIETHFHVFVSLAVLAAYADWFVLIPATIVIALDHLLRGIFLPESVYGVLVVSPWRWLEHAGWVLCEVSVLIFSCRQSVSILWRVSLRTAELSRRTAELELAVQANRSIVDAALDAVVCIDAGGRITDWNPHAERLFGLSRNEAVGRSLAETIIPPEFRAQHNQGLAEYLATGRSRILNRRVEVVAQSEARGKFPVELSVVPIRTGEETRFSAFIRDITERLLAEKTMIAAKEAAVAADRAKSDFLANMSHEIRTPLNGILGFTKLLLHRDGELPRDERHDYLSTIHSSANNLLVLVNDVLDLSKIEAGHLEIDRKRCSPGQIIAEVASLLRAKALEKGLRLDARCAGGVASTIESDPARLRQLILNIVGNAVKFTERGHIEIVARFTNETGRQRFRIEVIDTGPGIPADRLESIFKPFVQVDNSVTRKYGGTGLGLAISRRIAEGLGGSLTVTSHLGSGTRFIVDIDPGMTPTEASTQLLPVEVYCPKPLVANGKTPKVSGRILLVEDGDTNRKLVGIVLRRMGIDVVEAENGEIGVRIATVEPFDLILMDMQMPVMDGYTATRRLREHGLTTPIVALTAHAMKGDDENCRAAGCSGYLMKPIDPDVLTEVVSEILSQNTHRKREKAPANIAAGGTTEAPLLSTLPMDDPEFRLVVSEFRDRLIQKLASMRSALTAGDFVELGKLAHWLKGSGGTVGFPVLSERAARLQDVVREQSVPGTSAALTELEALAARIRLQPNEVPSPGEHESSRA